MRKTAIATFVCAVAALVLTYPLAGALGEGFFAPSGSVLPSGLLPNDHFNNHYRLWLFTTGVHFRDPFAFGLAGGSLDPPLGWLFAPLYVALHVLAGPEVAYNLCIFASLGLTAAFGYLWLRSTGVDLRPALIGAIALMVFPASYARTTVHLKALFLWLIPLALWMVQRGRNRSPGWHGVAAGLTVFTLLTVIEPETAVYFWPLLIVYAVGGTHRRLKLGLAVGLALSVAYLVWFYAAILGPSVNAGGRTLAQLLNYSPTPRDLLRRTYSESRLELYVYPGIGAAAAVLGWARLWRSAAERGVKLFAACAPLVALAALGPNAPLIGRLYRLAFEHVRPLRAVQTPGRIIFVLGPMIALGVAWAASGRPRLTGDVHHRHAEDVSRISSRLPAALGWAGVIVAAALLVADARAVTWKLAPPLPAALFAKAQSPTGFVDLPITNGIDYRASLYNEATTLQPAPRLGGVSPFLPKRAPLASSPFTALDRGEITDDLIQQLCSVRASHIVVWRELYGLADLPADADVALRALRARRDVTHLGEAKGIVLLRLSC